MAIFVARALFFAIGVYSAAGLTCEQSLYEKCEFSIGLSKSISLIRDAGAPESICQYLEPESKASPFINRISLIKWKYFENEKIDNSDFFGGFFEFYPDKRV